MVKTLLKSILSVILRNAGSIHVTRILQVPGGPVTLYPSAQVNGDCTFGGYNYIHRNAILANAKVGRFTYISADCRLIGVNIGSFCSIAGEVIAGAGIHPTHYVSTHPTFYSPDNTGFPASFATEKSFGEQLQINIGHDVWIGYRAILMDGITIGNGAIVGAGAVVTRDVEPYSIVAGVPGKLIRYRFSQEIIEQIQRSRWWEKDIEWIRANTTHFTNVEQFLRLCRKDSEGG